MLSGLEPIPGLEPGSRGYGPRTSPPMLDRQKWSPRPATIWHLADTSRPTCPLIDRGVERVMGFEPMSGRWQRPILPLNDTRMERTEELESSSPGWKPGARPLYHARLNWKPYSNVKEPLVGAPVIETGPRVPKTRMRPLHHTPKTQKAGAFSPRPWKITPPMPGLRIWRVGARRLRFGPEMECLFHRSRFQYT
jgi:hypothetical protein